MDRREESCLNKVRYESKEDALRAYKGYITMMHRNRGHRVNKNRHSQRPYRCEYCKGWHLTTIRK